MRILYSIMEKLLLKTQEDFQNWFKDRRKDFFYSEMISKGKSDTPLIFPCIVVWSERYGYGYRDTLFYDFVYLTDFE